MAVTIRRIGYTSSSVADSGGVSSGDASRYTESFNNSSDWSLVADDYVISIDATTHGKGINPTINVYMDNGVTFEEAIVPITISSSGLVKIYVTALPDNRFTGKLIII